MGITENFIGDVTSRPSTYMFHMWGLNRVVHMSLNTCKCLALVLYSIYRVRGKAWALYTASVG